MSAAYERLVELLDWPGVPGRRNAYCPCHEGDGKAHRPSLSVGERDDGDGALVKCWGGCSAEDVLAALDLPLAALFDSYWLRSWA